MLTDIEIARNTKIASIEKIAKKLGLGRNDFEQYGKTIAKINADGIKSKKQGELILVTAINPTASGEGKTTVSIGLADALSKCLKQKTCLALREPSLGPVFGIKGGATGGGFSQIVPMEDINLHFSGDFHAITSANNLLSSVIDNHIHQGNELDIDEVYFQRCVDLNDRALKNIELASGRKDGFTITSASEVMAILALAKDLADLKNRLGNILVGKSKTGKLIFARDFKVQDAMTILLKNAIKPNLVQTLIGTPAIVHAGPFANIAHGCNSVIATKTALSLADFVVTEAGFGADLGAEKFLDLKCQTNGLVPSVVVIVATIKALKLHGGESKENLASENMLALEKGFLNLERHVNNIKNVYGLPVVVAINKFLSDTDEEIERLKDMVASLGEVAVVTEGFSKGAEGATDLAKVVVQRCNKKHEMTFAYNLKDPVKTKIQKVAQNIYGAKSVVFEDKAQSMLEVLEKNEMGKLPVIIAKTQYSFSDNKDLIGAPSDFEITVRDIKICSGAGFVVAMAGKILLMPGLAKHSAYEGMSIDENGVINGLY